MKTLRACLTCLSALVVVATLIPLTAEADTFTFTGAVAVTPLAPLLETPDWLLVGTSNVGVGEATSGDSGWELGAHLPLDGDVPTNAGPDVGGVTLPAGAAEVGIGIGGNDDTTITDPTGTFDFQNFDGDSLFDGVEGRSGIYGDTGVMCAGPAALTGDPGGGCIAGNSNSYFYDTDLTPAGMDHKFPLDLSGTTLLSTSNGIVQGDLQPLQDELAAARTAIPLLGSSGTLPGGDLFSDWTIVLSDPGFYVLDVVPDPALYSADTDWNLHDFDILIDGVAGSSLIIRFDGFNLLTSNSFIGIGDNGIGLNNVLFYTDRGDDEPPDTGTHYGFNGNTVFNGVAFWDLSATYSTLKIGGNSQGCVQFIGDSIVLNNVRYNNCAFNPTSVPEPSTLLLLGTGLGAVAYRRRRWSSPTHSIAVAPPRRAPQR